MRESIRSGLWPIPALCVLISAGLAIGTLAIDRSVGPTRSAWYIFGGSAEGARALLSTTSAAMLTFMALVFSITIVALQLASGQLSPRVQRAFLRDTQSKLTLGVFIGTFTFAVLILRTVRGDAGGPGGFVPGLSTTVAVALVLTSVGFFVRYIDHIAHSIRAGSVIRRVGEETVAVIGELYPEDIPPAADDVRAEYPDAGEMTEIVSQRAGVVVGVDGEQLMRIATRLQLAIAIAPRVGDFVPTGGAIASISGDPDDKVKAAVRKSVSLAAERSMRQDVAFGIRQLVDIAERALSPGINDPTTAVLVLDALHEILRRLILRRFPSELQRVDGGAGWVFTPAHSWAEFLSLALDEIRLNGAHSVPVERKIRTLLEDLLQVVPPSRRGPVRTQLERLDESTAAFDEQRR